MMIRPIAIKSCILILLLLYADSAIFAQTQIRFNLYTDSLKKHVANYINIEIKKNQHWMPALKSEVLMKSSIGKWDGFELWIDSTTNLFVDVEAQLVSDTTQKIYKRIYFKKIVPQSR